MTTKIIDEVMKGLPSNAEVSEALFEGSNIVIYTKNSNYFLNNESALTDFRYSKLSYHKT